MWRRPEKKEFNHNSNDRSSGKKKKMGRIEVPEASVVRGAGGGRERESGVRGVETTA